MLDVVFKFDLGQWVITPFADQGYVTSNMLDEGGVLKCYVRSKQRSGWYLESELRIVPETEELKLTVTREGGK